MDSLGNIMVMQKPAGATDNDLPWWFHLYHAAWLIGFFAAWYFSGFLAFIILLILVGGYFTTFS